MKKIMQTLIILFSLLQGIHVSAQGDDITGGGGAGGGGVPLGGSISGPFQIDCQSIGTYTFSAGFQNPCSAVSWRVQFPDGSWTNYSGNPITVAVPTGLTQGWLTIIANASGCRDGNTFVAGYQTQVGGTLVRPYSISGSARLCNSSVGDYTVSATDNAVTYTFSVPPGWKINGLLTTTFTTFSRTVSITSPAFGTGTAQIGVRANPLEFGCLTVSDETIMTVKYGTEWPEITASSTILSTNSFGSFYYDGFGITNIQWIIPSGLFGSPTDGPYLTLVTGSTPGIYVIEVTAQSCGMTVGAAIVVTVSSPGSFLLEDTGEDAQVTTKVKPISEIDLSEDITLYPNPVSDELFIRTSHEDISWVSISMTNLSNGKQIFFNPLNNDSSIDLSNVTSGAYVLNITTSTGEQIQKKIQIVR